MQYLSLDLSQRDLLPHTLPMESSICLPASSLLDSLQDGKLTNFVVFLVAAEEFGWLVPSFSMDNATAVDMDDKSTIGLMSVGSRGMHSQFCSYQFVYDLS